MKQINQKRGGKKFKVIYIASPYTIGDIAVNVKNQIDTAYSLIIQGFVPIVPLLSHFIQICHPLPVDTWYKIDLELLKRSDAVLRLPGKSTGADNEIKEAKKLGIPVFYSLKDLIA